MFTDWLSFEVDLTVCPVVFQAKPSVSFQVSSFTFEYIVVPRFSTILRKQLECDWIDSVATHVMKQRIHFQA